MGAVGGQKRSVKSEKIKKIILRKHLLGVWGVWAEIWILPGQGAALMVRLERVDAAPSAHTLPWPGGTARLSSGQPAPRHGRFSYKKPPKLSLEYETIVFCRSERSSLLDGKGRIMAVELLFLLYLRLAPFGRD